MKKNQGFTLIEIMIVVAIVAILASIAYPSYTEHVQRGNRAEGMAFLNDAAARQERFYAQNKNKYATDSTKLAANLGLNTNLRSETGKYTLSVSATNGYTLTATNTFNDTKCGNLTLDATGKRDATGPKGKDYCWR